MINGIIKFVLGTEIAKKNFNKGGLLAAAIVIIVGYFIFVEGDFLATIDNLLKSFDQPEHSFITVRFSFFMIFVKIITLSLFTKKQNMPERFIAAFVTQLFGMVLFLIFGDIVGIVENEVEDPEMKEWLPWSPYIVNIMIILAIRGIYAKRTFNIQRYFGTRK